MYNPPKTRILSSWQTEVWQLRYPLASPSLAMGGGEILEMILRKLFEGVVFVAFVEFVKFVVFVVFVVKLAVRFVVKLVVVVVVFGVFAVLVVGVLVVLEFGVFCMLEAAASILG